MTGFLNGKILALEYVLAGLRAEHDSLRAENAELKHRLERVRGALEPVREQDWHGKWRVIRAIEATDLEEPCDSEGKAPSAA